MSRQPRPSEQVMAMIADTKPEYGVFDKNNRKVCSFGEKVTAERRAEAYDGATVRKIDKSELRPELQGCEGYRVEVTDADGLRRRFIVGRSTGWRPVHLEIKRRDSHGGMACDSRGYTNVRRIEYVR